MNKASRLALFLPSLYGGGAERVMVTLANAFAAQGAETDLVVARAHGKYGKYVDEVSPDVRLVILGTGRLLTALPALISYVQRERPDAMLSAINLANVLAVTAKVATRSKMRLVLSEHAMLSNPGVPGDFRARLMPHLMRITYGKADTLVAVSTAMAEDVTRQIGIPASKIHVIHNPIDFAMVVARSAEAAAAFGGMTHPLIVSAGRLEAAKDYPTLISAFAGLRRKRPATLAILGEGSQRNAIEAQVRELGIAEDVVLPGFVDNPYSWMRQADLFVMSSAWEGFGNVLVEAMACGTPVVSTDCPGGPAEILEQGRWGTLVPVGDVDRLTAAMEVALDDRAPPDVRHRAAQFSVEEAVARYLELLLTP